MVNDPTDQEWQDANAERWSEFIPGHPLFTQNDMDNLMRWKRKAQLGLPALPEARMQPIPEDEMDRDLFGSTDLTEEQLRQRFGIDPGQTPGSFPSPTPSTALHGLPFVGGVCQPERPAFCERQTPRH
jgi:hypothetical protein